MRRESTCLQCSTGSYLKWADADDKDTKKCGSCDQLSRLRTRETSLTTRISNRKARRERLDEKIQNIDDKIVLWKQRIDIVQENNGNQDKIENLNTRIASAQERRKRKVEKREYVDKRYNELSTILKEVTDRIDELENHHADPGTC